MKNLWQFFEKLIGIYRWHPKIALRYLPMVEEINKFDIESLSIIEVGSAGLGIVPYIKKRVIGVDLMFPPPLHEDLIPIKASALSLPFADNSFDIVISTDMLEHISPNDRFQAIVEMIRIGKKLVCIGVPTSKLSEEQDEYLKKQYEKKHKAEFNFLEEQVEYGLPTKDYMQNLINEAAKKLNKRISLRVQGNINLKVRKILMEGWISNNFFVNLFFRKILLVFIPLLRRLNQEPTYRTIFTATIHT